MNIMCPPRETTNHTKTVLETRPSLYGNLELHLCHCVIYNDGFEENDVVGLHVNYEYTTATLSKTILWNHRRRVDIKSTFFSSVHYMYVRVEGVRYIIHKQ